VPLGPNASHRLGITQTIRDVEGDALEADVSVEFTTGSTTTPAVTTVEVTPPSATLEMGDVLGDSVQLASTVRSAQGIVTDREVIWSTSDPSVAVVSSGGLVKARGPGPATITARSEGQEGSAQIIVVPMPVAEVVVYVVGPTPTVSVGATVFVDAGTRDRNDQPLTRRLIEWQSSDVSVAAVDQRGLVTGVAPGTVTITATSEGVSGTVGIAVGIPLMIDRVDIDPPVRVVPLGGIAQLTARAYRCDGGAGTCSEVTDAVTWASADPQVAVVDQTGRLTALRTGLVAITATVDDMQGTAAVTVVRPEPVAFASVDAGYYHTCGLTPSGEAYCWGQNVYASLGIGTWGLGLETSLVEHAPGAIAPLPVTGGLAFTSLSVGGWHACGLTSGGTVYCWGLALQNQLGQSGERGTHACNVDGVNWPCTPAPIPLSSALQFRSIHAGGLHTCGLTESGEAYCWGGDRYGQAGDGGGATHHGTMPTPVAGGHRFSTLSPGARYVCGITTEGKAYCWGYNYDGQLGEGTNVNRDSPVAVAGNLTFASINAIGQTTCAITTSGETYCWGDGYYGQLGDGGQSSSSYSPVAVRGGPFTSLAVGEFSACGLTSSGAAYCWGSNWRGMLGDGSRSQRDEPVAVAGGLTFASITSGASHVCGLTTSGVAYCWGWNASGQLGDGSAIDRATPVRVVGQP
jgi:alpha-tubulin suppressor-like RCC1 family protein